MESVFLIVPSVIVVGIFFKVHCWAKLDGIFNARNILLFGSTPFVLFKTLFVPSHFRKLPPKLPTIRFIVRMQKLFYLVQSRLFSLLEQYSDRRQSKIDGRSIITLLRSDVEIVHSM